MRSHKMDNSPVNARLVQPEIDASSLCHVARRLVTGLCHGALTLVAHGHVDHLSHRHPSCHPDVLLDRMCSLVCQTDA